eukprot:5891410-Alexandrium_andersonii.AAC.1
MLCHSLRLAAGPRHCRIPLPTSRIAVEQATVLFQHQPLGAGNGEHARTDLAHPQELSNATDACSLDLPCKN